MSKEWRDNLWIILGLTIVSLAIWLFCSALFSTVRYTFLPMGFDESDVFVVDVNTLDPSSSGYVDFGEETEERNKDDMRTLLTMIRDNGNVEAAGFALNGTPYNFSGINSGIYIKGDEPDSIGFRGNFRYYSPEVVKVLRLRSLTGKGSGWLYEKLMEGEMFVSPDPEYDPSLLGKMNEWGWPLGYRAAEDMVGKNVNEYGDSITSYHVADMVELVRRSEFDPPGGGGVIIPIDESHLDDIDDILIRVKPGRADKFREEFESSPELMMRRNVFLGNLILLSEKSKTVDRQSVLDVRLYLTLIGFFLIILFLGLFGTFWFRIQQRISEIAIRRVFGARRKDIFSRIIAEGMLLLIGATIIAGIIGWILLKKTELIEGFSTQELIWFEIATAVIVAVGIILSVIYPAWKAMQIQPAIAVRNE